MYLKWVCFITCELHINKNYIKRKNKLKLLFKNISSIHKAISGYSPFILSDSLISKNNFEHKLSGNIDSCWRFNGE